MHTGAPFFAGSAALCCGLEEITIITTPSAATPIKCYSPAFQVLAELPEENGSVSAENFIERVKCVIMKQDAFCIGPGLGEDPVTRNAVSQLIAEVRSAELPLVIDDDGLQILIKEPELFTMNIPQSPVILTPNKTEFESLWYSWVGAFSHIEVEENEEADRPDDILAPVFDVACPQAVLFDVEKYLDAEAVRQTLDLAKRIGPNIIILRKGYNDLIVSWSKCFVNPYGQVPRRCEGQGVIIAGLCTAFLAWMRLAENFTNPLIAAYGASIITRHAVKIAFGIKDRSMLAPEIISALSKEIELYLVKPNEAEMIEDIGFGE